MADDDDDDDEEDDDDFGGVYCGPPTHRKSVKYNNAHKENGRLENTHTRDCNLLNLAHSYYT